MWKWRQGWDDDKEQEWNAREANFQGAIGKQECFKPSDEQAVIDSWQEISSKAAIGEATPKVFWSFLK